MKKREYFFSVFKRSISDPSYYKYLEGKSFWFSLRYLFFLLLLTSVVFTMLTAVTVIPFIGKAPGFISSAKTGLINMYPAELEVRFQSGTVSTNVKEPYNIDLPAQWKEVISKEPSMQQYEHLLVIDTKASPVEYPKLHTLVLLTKDSIVVPPRNNERDLFRDGYQVKPIDASFTQTINKRIYDKNLRVVLPYLDYIPAFLAIGVIALVIILPFILAGFSLLGHLFSLLLSSLLLWFIAVVWGKKLGYSQIYRLSMHGATLAILYSLVQKLFGFHIPFGASAILLIWMVFVMREFPSERK